MIGTIFNFNAVSDVLAGNGNIATKETKRVSVLVSLNCLFTQQVDKPSTWSGILCSSHYGSA